MKILFIITFIACLSVSNGYLKTKLNNTIGYVNKSITFTCNSTWGEPIIWWFSNNSIFDESVNRYYLTNTSEFQIIDQYPRECQNASFSNEDKYKCMIQGSISTLIITNISIHHDGVYTCLDSTGSMYSSYLNVKVTPNSCLNINPYDQIVKLGDNIILTAEHSHARIRYEFTNDFAVNDIKNIYDGDELNECIVDYRFSKSGTWDDNNATIIIRGAKERDAGMYIARNSISLTGYSNAYVVVFTEYPSCEKTFFGINLKLQCFAKYSGFLKPKIFLQQEDVTKECLSTQSQSIVNYINCTLDVTEFNRNTFSIEFNITQCDKLIDKWVWKYTFNNEKIYYIIKIAYYTTILFIIAVLCICTCIYRKQKPVHKYNRTNSVTSIDSLASDGTIDSIIEDKKDKI